MAPSGSTSPTAPVVGNTRLRKTTANKPLLATSKPIEEHIEGTSIRTDITNIITAKKLLNTHGLALPTAGTMLKQIVTAIFEFSASAGLGSTHAEILRAIAIVLYDAERAMDMTNIINKIETLIGGPLTIMVEKAEELALSTDKHKEALEEAVKEVRTNLSESLEGIDKATKSATQAIQNHTNTEAIHNGSEGPRTYAAAAKASIPGPLTKLLSRNEGQTRQILIDRRSLFMPKDATTQLTEAQLVTKAKLAIEMMNKDDIPTPDDLTFVSARKLPHGGIIYELNSKESTEWFNTPTNRSNFLERFGTNVTIKDRTFHVLMENVPISFVPESTAAIDDIEKKAAFTPKTILKAKYIKPIARRNPNQRTAHIILTFNSRESANHAIKFGLSVASKRVYGRKLLPEPSRCLKCHSFDGSHMATDCPKDADSCGTCGEQHRTAMCKVDDPNNYYCTNCEIKGHAAWSRMCPTFLSKWDAHKRRNDESKYRFYPTEDPLTWEKVDEQPNEWDERQQEGKTDRTAPTNQNFPPPQQNRSRDARPTKARPNQPQPQRPRFPNNIPLGSQSRLTDMWTQQDNTPDTQPQRSQSAASRDSFFSTLNYTQDGNAASGWE